MGDWVVTKDYSYMGDYPTQLVSEYPHCRYCSKEVRLGFLCKPNIEVRNIVYTICRDCEKVSRCRYHKGRMYTHYLTGFMKGGKK